jgi:PLP dependent protein
VARGPLASAPPAEVVASRLERLRDRLESAGRDPAEVVIVAVTKGFDESAPVVARQLGLLDIGENYPEELLEKAARDGSLRWHMLGTIQRRRIRALAPVVGCWQTVSRPEEVTTLSRFAPGVGVFVQVETTGLTQRNGCSPEEAPAVVQAAAQAGLEVRGLMTIGPPGGPQAAAPGFELVAKIARDLGLSELSMGMSDDIEVAAAAGSTMLRVGRALFGERPIPPATGASRYAL